MIGFVIDIFIIVLIADIYIGFARKKQTMKYQFQRYNMFNIQPGNIKLTMSKQYYNLPDNNDLKCEFIINSDGYLDKIRACNNILIGGSTAFGTGSTGNFENITGFLREKHHIDVLNLAIPGWNIEQEIIALLRNIEAIKPKKIVFFNGANNLAFGLPFNYHNEAISPDVFAFYCEISYADAVNQHFNHESNFSQRFKSLTKEALIHSVIVRTVYRLLRKKKSNGTILEKNESIDFEMLSNMAVKNYLEWLKIFVDIASSRGISVHCVLQPYYVYGRSPEEIKGYNFYNVNTLFDDYMIKAYEKLDSALSAFEGITYHPICREMSSESVGYFTDPVHLNRAGYEMVADKLKNIFKEEVEAC